MMNNYSIIEKARLAPEKQESHLPAYFLEMRITREVIKMNKKCNSCGKVKNLDFFHKRKSSKDGRQGVCKSCQHLINKKYLNKSKFEVKQNIEDRKNSRISAFEGKLKKECDGKGFELLSPYINSRKNVSLKCEKCLNVFDRTPQKIYRDNSQCPRCSRRCGENSEALFLEKVKTLGWSLSGKYSTNTTKIKMTCENGHEIEKTPKSIKLGFLCSICAKNDNSHSKKAFSSYVKSINYELLSEYETSNKKVDLKCRDNHSFRMTPSALKQGQRCPVCSRSESVGCINYTILERDKGLSSEECFFYEFPFLWNDSKYLMYGITRRLNSRMKAYKSSKMIFNIKDVHLTKMNTMEAFLVEQEIKNNNSLKKLKLKCNVGFDGWTEVYIADDMETLKRQGLYNV